MSFHLSMFLLGPLLGFYSFLHIDPAHLVKFVLVGILWLFIVIMNVFFHYHF